MQEFNQKKIVLDKDVAFNVLTSKKIGVIGYGNQGRAQSLNLKDSGMEVVIGLRQSSASKQKVLDDGLFFDSIENVVSSSDVLSVLVPDQEIPNLWMKTILPLIKKNQTILFSHGYCIHYKLIKVPDFVNVIMVAPSGGGNVVRDKYKQGSGVPNLLAIHQDFDGLSDTLLREYSKAIGGTRVCAFYSTFSEETETDLFGEQSILTGGLPWLLNESFKVLLEDGYDPIVAWFVCYYELKTIVDLFHDKGFDFLFDSISGTARYGGLVKGKTLMDATFKSNLKNMLMDIKNGDFHNEITNAEKLNLNQESFKELEYYSSKILNLLNKDADT